MTEHHTHLDDHQKQAAVQALPDIGAVTSNGADQRQPGKTMNANSRIWACWTISFPSLPNRNA